MSAAQLADLLTAGAILAIGLGGVGSLIAMIRQQARLTRRS